MIELRGLVKIKPSESKSWRSCHTLGLSLHHGEAVGREKRPRKRLKRERKHLDPKPRGAL